MSSIVTLAMNASLDIASATDRLVPEAKLRCSQPQYDAGGGGINVARAVKQLGGDPLAVFPCGGPSGTTVVNLLERDGVRYRIIPIRGATRENFHIEERATGRQFRFVIEGPTLDSREQARCLDTISSLQPLPHYLVASGSLPPGVSDDFYAQVAHVARHRGIRLILDTTGNCLRHAAPGAYLIKPSLQELEDLIGAPASTEAEQREALADLVRRGTAKAIMLSLAGDGALFATAEGIVKLPPIRVPVRSTVGAGDSMVAGIVFSLANGRSLLEAAKYGIAAATAAVLHTGTQLCRREDVDRFYGSYSLEPEPQGAELI